MLGGERGSSEEMFVDREPNGVNWKDDDKLLNLKLPDDEKLKERILQEAENWDAYMNNEKLLIKNHDGYVFIQNVWLFRFFNFKIPPLVLQRFRNCAAGLNFNLNGDIKNMVRNRTNLKNLKKRCYTDIAEHLKNDFNNTSLVLYHGPVGRPRRYMGRVIYRCYPCCFCGVCNLSIYEETLTSDGHGYGQFLTGDIDLNVKYNELIKHYNHHLRHVFAVQVPHHGAKKNWNSIILRDLYNSEFWIISSGLKNKYGHPSCRVVEDICFKWRKCFWVNEINSIMIGGRVIW